MTQFYSYLWLRERDGAFPEGMPYYAGKGSGRRAFQSQGHIVRRPKSRDSILVFPMISEAEAFESEVALIELFGRKDLGTGCLVNCSSGGGEAYVRIPWDAERKKAQAGRMRRQKLGGWNKGLAMPSISEKMKGNANGKAKKGIPLTDAHKEALQFAHQTCACPRHEAAFLRTVAWG